jgi:hypothetical protein
MALMVSKFNPENDPSKPKLGAEVEHQGNIYRIEKVESVLTRDILRELDNGEPVLMAKQGYDCCLSCDHPTRPGVMWLVWANEL